jgi:hypothetical protein
MVPVVVTSMFSMVSAAAGPAIKPPVASVLANSSALKMVRPLPFGWPRPAVDADPSIRIGFMVPAPCSGFIPTSAPARLGPERSAKP